ncbi:hypothetical protein FGB62_13g240 [Gracilaria domingensis]|nr:hypothetical protein FGB62_13g240 [Gracilaria domingensis]
MRASTLLSQSRYANNVPLALRLFDKLSVRKNISAQVARWSPSQNESASARIMFADIACHSDPSRLTKAQRASVRRQLLATTPSETILDVLEGLQSSPVQCLLDSPLLERAEVQKLLPSGHPQPSFDMFADPSFQQMAKKWSPAFLTLPHPHSARRAESLYGAMYLSEQWASSEQDMEHSASSTAHRKLVSKLSTRVAALFTGCRSTPFRYLDAYPELAIVVASFVCSGMCV